MQQLIQKVQQLTLAAKRSPCHRSWADGAMHDPSCLHMVNKMSAISPYEMGCEHEVECPYHFQGDLNRVNVDVEGEDYKLVLFYIKKGTVMPLHDHPNMSVFFRLVFGNLGYRAYDKIDEKYRYNDFVEDEYMTAIEDKKRIKARRSKLMNLQTDDVLFVRPSENNMHEFIAKENSCFFDICIPNYTSACASRRLSFFKDTQLNNFDLSVKKGGITELEYYTTPPVMPDKMDVVDLDYMGKML